MITRIAATALAVAGAVGVSSAHANAVTRETATIVGLKVFRFLWKDSNGLKRTVSLKMEGDGNPGHGGYAVQMTYQHHDNGKTKLLKANAEAGDGFGYFVAHERFRTFTDGQSDSIAAKIFAANDSPLGKDFQVTTEFVESGPKKKIIRFRQNYPKYGTKSAGGVNPNTGEDSPPIGLDPNLFQLYLLPVTLTWHFEDGKDYPLVRTTVDLSGLPSPDLISFDMRAPYGVLDFEDGGKAIKRVMWGDRFHFRTTATPLTRNSTWLWNAPNEGACYNALVAGESEMGLVEPKPFGQSRLADGYSEGRGKSSATYNNGQGCPFQNQKLPCDYEWAYQSAQYELPRGDPNAPVKRQKIAWGSTAFYGMSLGAVFDGTTAVPFDGFPQSREISYDVCVVLGPTTDSGLARKVALRGKNYGCASAP